MKISRFSEALFLSLMKSKEYTRM